MIMSFLVCTPILHRWEYNQVITWLVHVLAPKRSRASPSPGKMPHITWLESLASSFLPITFLTGGSDHDSSMGTLNWASFPCYFRQPSSSAQWLPPKRTCSSRPMMMKGWSLGSLCSSYDCPSFLFPSLQPRQRYPMIYKIRHPGESGTFIRHTAPGYRPFALSNHRWEGGWSISWSGPDVERNT